MCRQWEDKKGTNLGIATFEKWIRDVVHSHPVDPNDADDMDRDLMCSRLSQLATQYTRMNVYGNHCRVEDQQFATLQTYVTFVFHIPSMESELITLNYVGVLEDILKLNDGPLRTLVIFFRSEWMKQCNNRGNPTYVKNNVGFMVVNFRDKLLKMSEPFIFSSQATQIFWSEQVAKLGWKVVLAKEAHKDMNKAQQMYS